ncbi:UNVERIFIED_CONTAM: Outer membrane protein [Acetivibrio alkalicellulosi]
MMKKKLSGLVLVIPIVLTLTTVIAVESDVFNIRKYQTMALENSRQGAIDDLEIKARESALEDAEHDAIFQGSPRTRNERYNSEIKRHVNPLKAKLELEYAKRSKDKNEENLKFNVYKATLDILLKEKELDLESKKLDILNEKYKMNEARHREGKITENDLFDSKFMVDTKIIDVDKVKKDLEALNLELKRLLNLNMDNSLIKVEDKLVFEPIKRFNIDEEVDLVIVQNIEDRIDLEQIVKQSIENSLEFYKESENLNIQEKIMEITEKVYDKSFVTYNENKLNLEIAKISVEDLRTSIEVNVRNKYNDLLNQEDKVELALLWEEIQKKKLDAEEFKFEKGMISKEELLGAKESYIEAYYQKYVAICGYNIIKAEFQKSVGNAFELPTR